MEILAANPLLAEVLSLAYTPQCQLILPLPIMCGSTQLGKQEAPEAVLLDSTAVLLDSTAVLTDSTAVIANSTAIPANSTAIF